MTDDRIDPSTSPVALQAAETHPGRRSVLIVGGGLGAFHTAHALRRHGFAGSISVLGAEPHLPYDRPPLSKDFLAGVVQAEDLRLDDRAAPLDVDWIPGVQATALIDGGVRASDGSTLTADAVVLATGADAIRLGPPVLGTHVLRTLDDAEGLKADGIAGRDVVVIGTGFIGLEAASSAAHLAAESVTVVGMEEAPLAQRFGEAVSESVRALHARHGVQWQTGVSVSGLHLDDSARVAGVMLAHGDTVPGDLVIVGIGVRPATGWLCGDLIRLDASRAVACDAYGATSMDRVWAIGDCASWQAADGARRAGHWQDAIDQAAVVAATLTGSPLPGAKEPYCWSDQFGVRIQMAGQLDGSETSVVLDGSVGEANLLVSYRRDGQEVAILGMDRLREVTRWRRTRERAAATAASAA